MTQYELQRYEQNPHQHLENLTKNRTYHSMRWKGIAISDDYDKIKALCPMTKDYRVVNLDNLEVL